MLIKTKGIVLKNLKYSDSRIIAHVLTPDYGKIPLMVRKNKTKKSNGKSGYFQPLHLLDIEFSFKESRNLQQLTDVHLAEHAMHITSNYHKQNISIFLADVMNRCIKEMEPDDNLFQYIWHSILMFENIEQGGVNFHLYFLTHLMKYLGFEPGNKWNNQNRYLDMDSGLFVSEAHLNASCLSVRESKIIHHFLHFSASNIPGNGISNQDRKLGLEAIINYFDHHVPGFGKLKSYEVLKSLYN
ncbi:MAG: DNA repair protein RecO [Bacteroidota bacterium]